MMNFKETKFDFPMPVRYHLSPPNQTGLAVIMHGYQDHAGSVLKRLGWDVSAPPFQMLAINAPFPVPVWTADGFKEAYSWYFRDTSRGLTYVSPQTTAQRLGALLEELGLTDTPKVFFGFSQGGFLAPYVAKETRAVRGIVGFGCGFNEEAYDALQPLPVYALHGERDERVSLERTREEYAAVSGKGFPGEFQVLPAVGHKLDTLVEPRIRDLIVRCLEGQV